VSSWTTLRAPSRMALLMQSALVSPAPITTTVRPAAEGGGHCAVRPAATARLRA